MKTLVHCVLDDLTGLLHFEFAVTTSISRTSTENNYFAEVCFQIQIIKHVFVHFAVYRIFKQAKLTDLQSL